MGILALILAIGATVRLTRLVTTDALSWRLRAYVLEAGVRYTRWLLRRSTHPQDPSQIASAAAQWWPYQLVTCPWCISAWIAAPAVTVAYLQPAAWWFLIPAAALTASHLAGLASRLD